MSKVSQSVVRRMPRYYRHLTDLCQIGVERISSQALGERMGLTASQIRQDLNCFGGFGQQGYGYNVQYLRTAIGEILGVSRGYSAVLIGMGNLGQAIAKNFRFERLGVNLLAGFDIDSKIIGQTVGGVEILSMEHLSTFVTEKSPTLAIMTLPRAVAHDVARKLVELGIRGLWNFTDVDLQVQDVNIPVEHVHFSDSLMTLCYMLDNRE